MSTTGASDLAPSFKAAARRLVAGVSVVTTASGGARHGMTVTTATPVSMQPPMFLICVNRQASMHAPLVESARFAVNLLRGSHAELARAFASKPAGEARFLHGQWQADADGVPVLADAGASVSCAVFASVEAGEQTLFVGRATEVRLPDAHDRLDALAFAGGTFLPLGTN